jgi:ribosomal protein S18 acetylase RimI-like enzyme
MPSLQPTLVTAKQLTARERRQVADLIARCQAYEPVDLPLLLDPCLTPEDEQDLYFLAYQDDALAGAASTWPGQEIEAIGAVDPGCRRQGMGRVLLDALRQEARRRGTESMLLVCEENAPSGIAFAGAVGAQHEFGEYRMELDRERYAQVPAPPKTLDLRQAEAGDLEALVGLWTASSDVYPSEARETTGRWLAMPNQLFYVGWMGTRPVGSVRLYLGESSVYLNSFRVHPELRGRGYGRQILMGVLDLLVAEGWPHIMIEVATDNAVALSLYRSCGYRAIAAFQYYRLEIAPL